jgi:hypothetical protein
VRVFLPALRKIEPELMVPIPDQLRILRELEFDLEGLRTLLVAQGLSAEEARNRALDALVPDHGAIQELGRLHAPLYRRATRHLSEDRLRVLERSALALVTASVLIVQAIALVQANLLRDASPFLWPVLGLGALLFTSIAAKTFELWVKGDHRAPDRGLQLILILAGVILATGMSGVFVDFYRLAESLERAPGMAKALAPLWLVRDCALLSVSMMLALAGGLTWFVLTQWLTLVTGARREVLGLDNDWNS